MNNVLKNTLIYTGIYFVYCILVMLVLVAVQIFWKPVVFMFCIILALLSFEHYSQVPMFDTPAQLWTKARAKFAKADDQHAEDMADWRAMNGITK